MKKSLLLLSLVCSSTGAMAANDLRLDGDWRNGQTETFWQSDWMTGDGLPATFTLELPEAALLRGFNYTPRADMNRGRIASYAIEVSRDGKMVAVGNRRSLSR